MPAAPDFPPAPDRVVPKRALISVSDKTGLVEAARVLAAAGVELVSTGGTRKAIGAMHAVKSGSRPKRDVVPNWTAAERRAFMEILSDYLLDR